MRRRGTRPPPRPATHGRRRDETQRVPNPMRRSREVRDHERQGAETTPAQSPMRVSEDGPYRVRARRTFRRNQGRRVRVELERGRRGDLRRRLPGPAHRALRVPRPREDQRCCAGASRPTRPTGVDVLVNDFGDFDIDAVSIGEVRTTTIALSNGRVCCHPRRRRRGGHRTAGPARVARSTR